MGEQTINIPNIAIGSEYRAPLALSNESEITACLVIDLNKYQDFMPTIHDIDSGDKDSTKQYDAHHNCIELVEEKSNQNAPPSNTWKVTLQPKSTLEASCCSAPAFKRNTTSVYPLISKVLRVIRLFIVHLLPPAASVDLACQPL